MKKLFKLCKKKHKKKKIGIAICFYGATLNGKYVAPQNILDSHEGIVVMMPMQIYRLMERASKIFRLGSIFKTRIRI